VNNVVTFIRKLDIDISILSNYSAAMDRLNYHHLFYFWVVARHGGLGQSSEDLLLSRSTLSSQIHQLEGVIGHQLLRRSGRRLELTDVGRTVFTYCDKMFTIGRELGELIGDANLTKPRYVRVGVSDVIPRLVVGQLLRPLFATPNKVRLVCREDHSRRLLAELAAQNLDLVIDGGPLESGSRIKGHSHRLGRSDVVFFGAKRLVSKYRSGFPESLDGAPILLPTEGSVLRHEIENWFERLGIKPQVVGEFDDRDLLEVFGHLGAGMFPAPEMIRRDLAREYNIGVVGRATGLVEQYYAISIQRNIGHPLVEAILRSLAPTESA
jgi:LysR family transcriptional regulator, transcriptional activator of nhaA